MLPKIPFGSYDYEECFEQKSPVNTNCTITCDEGFELKGPAVKTCATANNRNGAWTQKSKIPRCVDVTPPNIVCPKDYSIELIGNKSYVLLTSFKELEVMEGKCFELYLSGFVENFKFDRFNLTCWLEFKS